MQTANTSYRTNSSLGIILIGILFFIFGFITWANSQLIPYFKIACQLTETQSYYVATAFFAAYFFMSIPSSYILKKTGYKLGMALGLVIMAIGALLFIPAANMINYPLFLTALFIIGTGLAFLQTASNPYVTILGPQESAARRLSIMGVCNKLAGIVAIYILGSIALKDADKINEQIIQSNEITRIALQTELLERVKVPYIIIAVILIILAGFILKLMPEVKDEADQEQGNQDKKIAEKPIYAYPQLMLGVVAIFLYVGVEVISYDTFTNFGTYLNIPFEEAKSLAQYTGYSLLLGYFVGIALIPKVINQKNALAISAILSIVLILIAINTTGYTAVIAFALLGFSNAAIWPAIWPLALHNVGTHTKLGSALLVTAIVGGAVLMPLYGKVSEWLGNPQIGYSIMIPCYLFILYYALSGHKLRSK